MDTAIAFVDWSRLAEQFDKADSSAVPPQDRAAVIQWCRRFMTMYLVDDHAAVNRAGHCNPRHEGYSSLPETPPREGRFRARESLTPPVPFPDDFWQMAGVSNPEFAFVFQPEGLPHDAICLVWTLQGGNWKITRMFSIVS
jgi:hypothetical protein